MGDFGRSDLRGGIRADPARSGEHAAGLRGRRACLQEIVPKHRIKFLNVGNEKVRKAVEQQGECWRIALLPRSLPEMIHMIAASKVRHRQPRDLLLRPDHRNALPHLPGVRRPGIAGRRRPAAAIDRDPGSVASVQSAGDGRDRLLHGRRPLRRGRIRRMRLRRPGFGRAAVGPRFAAAAVRGGRQPRVPPRRPRDVQWRSRMYASLLGQDDETCLRRAPAGHEFRVLHADPVAARRPDRRRRVDLRPDSRGRARRATAIRKSQPSATRSAGGSSSISSANTATWSTSMSAGSSVRSPAGPRSSAAATSTWSPSSSAAATRRS